MHVLADVPLFRFGVSPNKLFEYMAAGLPVITNAPGEVGDLVVKSKLGIVVEPEHLESAMLRMAELTPRSAGVWAPRGGDGSPHTEPGRGRKIECLLDSLVGGASEARRST